MRDELKSKIKLDDNRFAGSIRLAARRSATAMECAWNREGSQDGP